jgi:DNA primase
MDDVQEIKDRLDIVEVIGSYVTLKKSGNNYKGLCPFHQEKSPSFMVNPERQIFKCFGCGEGGDVFEFIQKQENLTFPETLEVLADRAGYKLTRNQSNQNKYPGMDQPNTKSKLYKINQLAAQLFHKILIEHPLGKPALEYLTNRGLALETITTFTIGFAPDKQFLTPALTKRNFTSKEIELAGRPDRFRNRIIFPISDTLGNIVGFTGRLLESNLPANSGQNVGPKYFNTPETPIFHKSRVLYGLKQARQAIKDLNYVVLLEGQMDVALAYQAGIKNVVASSGTALTPDHLKVIGRYCENIIFSFDMDEAGRKATLKGLEMAWELGFTLKVAILPSPFKDAGEAVKKDPEIFKNALKNASYALGWLVDSAFERITNKEDQPLNVVEKKQIAKEILPFISKIADPIEQSHWINYLAKKLAVSENSIKTSLEKIKNRQAKEKTTNPNEEFPKIAPHALMPEEILYGLLRLHPQYQKDYQQLYNQLDKEYTNDKKQLELAVEEYQKTFNADQLPGEIKALVGRHGTTERETLKSDFASHIAQAEASGDRQKVKDLLNKLQSELVK